MLVLSQYLSFNVMNQLKNQQKHSSQVRRIFLMEMLFEGACDGWAYEISSPGSKK